MRLTKQHRQVVLLYCSSAAGVLLGALVTVLNTRYLSKEAYGDMRFVANVIVFAASLLLLGYFVSGSRLTAIAKSDRESRGIRGAMVVLLIATVLVVMLVMAVCAILYGMHGSPVSGIFWAAVPVCGAPVLLNYINTALQGDNKIGGIAVARLLPALVYLVAGFFIYRNIGATPSRVILLQNGIGMAVCAAVIVYTRPSFSNLKHYFRQLNAENRSYGLHVYIGSVAGVSLGYLAGITLSLFNDTNVAVGFYTLALTVSTPLIMLPSIIGVTYFKSFALSDRIAPRIIWGTVLLSVLTLLIFVVVIGPVVDFMYDEQYAKVAGYAAVLAVGMTLHGIGDVFNRFLGAHGMGKYMRNGAFLTGGILVLGNVFLVWFFGIWGAIATRILSSVGYSGAMIAYYSAYRRRVSAANPERL